MDAETTQSPAGQSPAGIPKSTETLFHLLNKLMALHDLADKKAYAALTIIGAIMLIAPGYIEKFINNVAKIHFFWQSSAYLLTLILIITSSVGLYHAIRTLVPRINSSESSIVFWGHAASLDLNKLKKNGQHNLMRSSMNGLLSNTTATLKSRMQNSNIAASPFTRQLLLYVLFLSLQHRRLHSRH